jgi:hypothetical protein
MKDGKDRETPRRNSCFLSCGRRELLVAILLETTNQQRRPKYIESNSSLNIA